MKKSKNITNNNFEKRQGLNPNDIAKMCFLFILCLTIFVFGVFKGFQTKKAAPLILIFISFGLVNYILWRIKLREKDNPVARACAMFMVSFAFLATACLISSVIVSIGNLNTDPGSALGGQSGLQKDSFFDLTVGGICSFGYWIAFFLRLLGIPVSNTMTLYISIAILIFCWLIVMFSMSGALDFILCIDLFYLFGNIQIYGAANAADNQDVKLMLGIAVGLLICCCFANKDDKQKDVKIDEFVIEAGVLIVVILSLFLHRNKTEDYNGSILGEFIKEHMEIGASSGEEEPTFKGRALLGCATFALLGIKMSIEWIIKKIGGFIEKKRENKKTENEKKNGILRLFVEPVSKVIPWGIAFLFTERIASIITETAERNMPQASVQSFPITNGSDWWAVQILSIEKVEKSATFDVFGKMIPAKVGLIIALVFTFLIVLFGGKLFVDSLTAYLSCLVAEKLGIGVNNIYFVALVFVFWDALEESLFPGEGTFMGTISKIKKDWKESHKTRAVFKIMMLLLVIVLLITAGLFASKSEYPLDNVW